MWSDEDATVVCKMLGYSGLGRIGSSLNRTQGVGPIWLDNVQCTGGESTLLQCRKNPWGRHNCDHSKDAWVVCSNGTFDDECIRYKVLNNSNRARTYAGQVNQCDRNSGIFPGQWHRFMGPAGNQMASSCVPENRCGARASGWLNGNHPTVNIGMVSRRVCFSFFGDCCKWSTSIRVKNCSGFYVYELQKPPSCNLRYCGQDILTPTTTTTAPTTPKPTLKPKEIRLAGRTNGYSGRVEVYHNGVWGTVCDDLWDLRDAKVVCRELGFTDAKKAHRNAAFGRGFGKIWLDNILCTGQEKSLGSCKHNGWGKHDCSHYEDAGVTCISDEMYSCDFERGLCEYKNTNFISRLTWVRKQATTPAPTYQPAFDHTLGAPTCLSGWYSLYNGHCYSLNNQETGVTWYEAAKKCQQKNGRLADIRSKGEWYFIQNEVLSNTSVQYFIDLHDVNGTGVWTYLDGTVMNLTNKWTKGNFSNSNDKDKCGAIVSGGVTDAVRFISVSCNQTYNSVSYVCKTSRYRKNLGYFLQMQSGSGLVGRRPLASLQGPELPPSKFSCLTFFYHMSGKNVDSLRVVLRSSQKDDLVWQLEGYNSSYSGNYSNGWNKAQIPLNKNGSERYRVVIQGARMGLASLDGFITIDDINVTAAISSSLCSLYPSNARPTIWESGMYGSCSFGNGTCGYTNDHTGLDYADWIKYDLANPTGGIIRKSAMYDHTTFSDKTGSYMYMHSTGQTSGQKSGQSARFISPMLSPEQAKCMSFYFYFSRISGSSDVELTVFVRYTKQTSVGDETPVWRLARRGSQAFDNWNKGVIPLNQKANFQIIFEGLLTGSSGIGLDDIWISESTECTMLPALASPPPPGRPKNLIRLASSNTNGTGRVEVYYRGRWGTVCGSRWTLNNAHVVCRQLGYEGAFTALCCGAYGGGTGRVWLSDVKCSGKESSITTCTHSGWGNNQCLHNQDAAVVCSKAKFSKHDIEVRLNGTSTKYQGRVEVKYADIWGTIDDSAWDMFDAAVICRQLAFKGAVSAFTGSTFGKGQGPTWSSNFRCHGNETNFSQCVDYKNVKYIASGKALHISDAGVECFDARLVDGQKPNTGRVQIQYRGKWGAICGKGWNMNAAHVVCRDLGYHRARSTSVVAKGSEDVLLDEVKCKGDEASIMFCLHSGINIHSCDKAVNVECSNDKINQEVNPCDSSPCNNNGKCSKVTSKFYCQCPRNFTGLTCQTLIGPGIIGILLKGDINKWNPLRFKESLAEILNNYCNDCNEDLIRKKRENERLKVWQFTSNDIIIVGDPLSRPSGGFLFVEFAVIKTINGKTSIIRPAKLRQAITKGSKNGIAGYKLLEERENASHTSYNGSVVQYPQRKTRIVMKSNEGFKIGFAVLLVVMLVIMVVVVALYITRRLRKNPIPITSYQLKIFNKNSSMESVMIPNENYTQFK